MFRTEGCDPDFQPSEAAEVHFASGTEYDFAGVLKPNRHERYVDDITGQPLPPDLCKKARATEALRRTCKPPITFRWVEVNKGDDVNPKIRSRLVAREIRMKGEELIFAPTPPLESLRMVLSHATTQFPNEKTKVWDGESPDRQMIYFMDISRAYFNAKVDESDPVYVDLPPELAQSGMCGM